MDQDEFTQWMKQQWDGVLEYPDRSAMERYRLIKTIFSQQYDLSEIKAYERENPIQEHIPW